MTPPIRNAFRLLSALSFAGWVGLARAGDGEEPICRRLSRELTSHTRLAGTIGSESGARWVAERLSECGFEVELDRRVVLLSHPRFLHVSLRSGDEQLFARTETFDPRAIPAGDVPIYNAWSHSGQTTARVVDVGRGLRADYARLARAGVGVAGRVVLARYGGSYRGIKAELAQAHGAAAILLFSDPEEDGAGKGEVYPKGRFKPGWAAQRGSISSLAVAPGDVTTPGWASPPPGVQGRRLSAEETAARLPGILCTPIGADEAGAILDAGEDARVHIELELERELFEIVNVLGRLPGTGEDFVIAGNHRDAWVRGAQDAGSGTVSLLRAAQLLRARVDDGWQPRAGIVLAFWDAEEFGLIGSTEWGEANAERLRENGLCYINADSTVSGLNFGAKGSAGFAGVLEEALKRVPDPKAPARNLWQGWRSEDGKAKELGLLGSGSDFTVFVHHLGLPALNFSFHGNAGGQYHTSFDDFLQMDRFLDPTWQGHETAARFVCELLWEMSTRGRSGFDGAEAAAFMARLVRRAGLEELDGKAWLGSRRAERIALQFDALQVDLVGLETASRLYQELLQPQGLQGRPWYRNPYWAPGIESGYAAETLPDLRRAARGEKGELDSGVQTLVDALEAYRSTVSGAAGAGMGETTTR